MKIAFPVSATVRASARLVDASAGWRRVDFPVRYGLIEHPREGIILIDTGYNADLYQPRSPALSIYRSLLAPVLLPEGDITAQLARRGARPADVRHIVLSHLHADHICGLGRFGNATIHASAQTLRLWAGRPSLRDIPALVFRGLLPKPSEATCLTVEKAPAFVSSGDEVSLVGHDILGDRTLIAVALPGHMAGHIGVFFPDRNLLYAVDAAWTLASVLRPQRLPVAARFIIGDRQATLDSLATLRAAHAAGVTIRLCHDPEPFL